MYILYLAEKEKYKVEIMYILYLAEEKEKYKVEIMYMLYLAEGKI